MTPRRRGGAPSGNEALGPRHDLVVDPQHDDGAEHRYDDAPDVDSGYAVHSEDGRGDKASNDRADDAKRDVHRHARAGLVDDLARDPTRNQPQNDPAENAHLTPPSALPRR